MKLCFLCMVFFLCVKPSHGQSEVDLIGAAVQRYIDGTSQNNPDLIASAFYEGAQLFLSREGQDIWLMSIQEYASRFDPGEQGQSMGRTGRIVSVEQQHDIALAKAVIEIQANGLTFVDVFILKRLSGEWKIISKAATRID